MYVYVGTKHICKTYLSELNHKTIQEAFWNDKTHSELAESDMKLIFHLPDDRESCMEMIDKVREKSENLYHHECYEGYKERGMYIYIAT